MMSSGFRFTDEWNLLIFEFWLNFLSTNCLISAIEVKGFMFFMTIFVKPVWVRGFCRSCQERYCLFLYLMFLHPFLFLCGWLPQLLEEGKRIWCCFCSLENSLIRFFICVKFLGLKVCGMLSINRIFRLESEFLKFTGRLFVSDNWFFLHSGGFSMQLSVPSGDGWFVIWSVDATDIWFDEWICFDWPVVIEGCEIGFSVWDWQDTDLVVCFMNCKMSIANVFAERILHLRHLKNGYAFLALMHLFILVISLLFILSTVGGTTAHIYCSLSNRFYFAFEFLYSLL